ncbi:hypothetical protein NQ317_003596 [Molorchus minor]|uniref:Uncharacterized protein n=1 Tax=Molorchus minor TaxID=1323400 RepID=A0ABQ9IQN5_9CUCU|nr:hypothetical protein NQ317_003596 [Molorchus minor]
MVPSIDITEENTSLGPVMDVDNSTANCSNKEPTTPKRRRFAEPRYIGDIRSPDLATPRRAKRSLTIAKEMITKQSRKIRTLQERNRNLRKKS